MPAGIVSFKWVFACMNVFHQPRSDLQSICLQACSAGEHGCPSFMAMISISSVDSLGLAHVYTHACACIAIDALIMISIIAPCLGN